MDYKEPTAEQCNENALVFEDEYARFYAIWYPQMGGYCGRAVVRIRKGESNSCFDIKVWHDGEFPFSDRDPADIHHCNATQFIQFGEDVRKLQELSMVGE